MKKWIVQNPGRVQSFAICAGFVLSAASWAEEPQAKPSEEPVVTSSPDPLTVMKVTAINPRDRKLTTVNFAKLGDSGTVRVQVCTDAKGRITKALPKESSGNPRVDAMATAVASLSKFSAGVVKGKAKAACTELPITINTPATMGELARLPEPWVGGTPPTVGFVPSIPSSSGNTSEVALTQVCADEGGKTVSVVLAMPSGDKIKDRDIVDLIRQFQIVPATVGGKHVAGCLLVPLSQ